MKAKGRYTIAGRISRSPIARHLHKWAVMDERGRAVSYHATWAEAERARRAMNKAKGEKAA